MPHPRSSVPDANRSQNGLAGNKNVGELAAMSFLEEKRQKVQIPEQDVEESDIVGTNPVSNGDQQNAPRIIYSWVRGYYH